MARSLKVRFNEDYSCRNVDPGGICTYVQRQEVWMVQPNEDRPFYWSDFDIDGAYIVPAHVVTVLEERTIQEMRAWQNRIIDK